MAKERFHEVEVTVQTVPSYPPMQTETRSSVAIMVSSLAIVPTYSVRGKVVYSLQNYYQSVFTQSESSGERSEPRCDEVKLEANKRFNFIVPPQESL
jgi:hypothetical protein